MTKVEKWKKSCVKTSLLGHLLSGYSTESRDVPRPRPNRDSRFRSVSFSVSLGLGRSVKVSAEVSVSVSDIVTFSANYARFWGCGYMCVCECGWVGGWMSFGEDVSVRNVGSICNSDLTILWRKIAWLMVTKAENYRYISRDDWARDLGRDDRGWDRPRPETNRDRASRSRYTPNRKEWYL
jgi:hypothetical protein